GLRAVMGHADLEPVPSEVAGHEPGQGLLVIDDDRAPRCGRGVWDGGHLAIVGCGRTPAGDLHRTLIQGRPVLRCDASTLYTSRSATSRRRNPCPPPSPPTHRSSSPSSTPRRATSAMTPRRPWRPWPATSRWWSAASAS